MWPEIPCRTFDPSNNASKNDRNMKFEVGQVYRGVSGVGYVAITVTKRTEKTITVDSCMEKGKTLRINTKWYNGVEAVMYRLWIADAKDVYGDDQQMKDVLESAYN